MMPLSQTAIDFHVDFIEVEEDIHIPKQINSMFMSPGDMNIVLNRLKSQVEKAIAYNEEMEKEMKSVSVFSKVQRHQVVFTLAYSFPKSS